MADDTTPRTIGGPGFAWYVEHVRTLLEQSLAAQQALVDGWASTLEGRTTDRAAAATPVRGYDWLNDVWSESLQNAMVHLDDAVTDRGVDLDTLQTIWLHATDDAITDVGRSPEFAATMAASVERALAAQHRANELRRAALRLAGLPTDETVEDVGRRLLDLEYRQKGVEDRVARLVEAVARERLVSTVDVTGPPAGPDESETGAGPDEPVDGTDPDESETGAGPDEAGGDAGAGAE